MSGLGVGLSDVSILEVSLKLLERFVALEARLRLDVVWWSTQGRTHHGAVRALVVRLILTIVIESFRDHCPESGIGVDPSPCIP